MSVKPLHKTVSKEIIPTSKHIERFIGGAEHAQSVSLTSDDHRLTLRIPKSLIDRIDILRAQRPGIISRNQCIIELLEKATKD